MILSFLFGLIIFFSVLFSSRYLNQLIPVYKKVSIGVVGAYTKDNLPPLVTSKFSRGLTKIAQDGSIKPDIAAKWEEQDSGKTYKFTLKEHEYFSNGQHVTSDKVLYNFSDTTVEQPDQYTIVYKLKDVYSPFLVTVSRGIFNGSYTGIGEYKIEDSTVNGDFIQSLTMTSVKNRFNLLRYQFYPTEEALKMAFLLGEVSEANGLTDPSYKQMPFSKFPNTSVEKVTDYARVVTLFYNTNDNVLSDKKARLALSYALPESYKAGKKAFLPYSPESIYYNKELAERKQDYEHAKLLLNSATPKLTVKTLKKYRPTAQAVADSWKKIGIQTTIEEVDGVPDTFQIFLGDITIPQDPDQYTLWHSSQANNITKYRNLRIDKLLEDGRKTVDVEERQRIYNDFQKYLMDDSPASFLSFQYEYNVIRK